MHDRSERKKILSGRCTSKMLPTGLYSIRMGDITSTGMCSQVHIYVCMHVHVCVCVRACVRVCVLLTRVCVNISIFQFAHI